MTDPSEGFADNWAYLRTELRWLDQVLMVAVARQRKESHDVERIAQSKADRATSAWWKGIITTEGKAVYDEHRQPQSGSKPNYHQQLETRLQASSKKGVLLALPALCDRLNLTLFEKNLVLMSLAPEVNRRYARLYRYLQGDDAPVKTDLPTLDLVLRLMCRNDNEWRSARQRLVTSSPLVQLQLLEFAPQTTDTLLNYPLKLSMPVINYLLAEQPTQDGLEALLQPIAPLPQSPVLLRRSTVTADWKDLVLPELALSGLRYLVQQVQGQAELCHKWGDLPQNHGATGSIALLVGEAGTGKTLAAEVIARSLQVPLYSVDLAFVEPEQYPQLLQEIKDQAPTVLLLKSAQLWLGRSAFVSPVVIRQFLAQRRQLNGITLLTAHHPSAIQVHWRQAVDQVVKFSMPTAADRLRLWQQAFPASVPLSPEIDWNLLAAQVAVSGGAIVQLAQAAIRLAAAIGAEQVEMPHLAEVMAQQGKPLKLSIAPSTKKAQPKSKSKTSSKSSNRRQASTSSRATATRSGKSATAADPPPENSPAQSPENPSEQSLEQSPENSSEQSSTPPIEPLAKSPRPSARKKRKAVS